MTGFKSSFPPMNEAIVDFLKFSGQSVSLTAPFPPSLQLNFKCKPFSFMNSLYLWRQ